MITNRNNTVLKSARSGLLKRFIMPTMGLILVGGYLLSQAVNAQHLPANHATRNNRIAHSLHWINTNTSSHHVTSTPFCKGYFSTPLPIRYLLKQYQHSQGTHLWAEGPVTDHNNLTILRKHVVVAQAGRVGTSDVAYVYRHAKTHHMDKIVLSGHVHLYEKNRLTVADQAIFHLSQQTTAIKTATLIHPMYRIHSDGSFAADQGNFIGWGDAQRGHRSQDATITLYNATYSSCNPNHPFWQFKAHKLVLDKKNDIGKVYHGLFRIKGIPLAYSPYYSFSLSGKRKTGWLTPYYRYNRRSGFGLGLPYYWNIAPNYDTTITPLYYTRRGFRFTDYFRYITPDSQGYLYASFLPHDQRFIQEKNDYIKKFAQDDSKVDFIHQYQREPDWRGFFSMQNASHFNENWSSHLYLNYLSDVLYFQDIMFGEVNGDTYVNQLLNRFDLEYTGQNWQTDLVLQTYQSLHIDGQDVGTVTNQYQQLPSIVSSSYYPHFLKYTDLGIHLDFSNFTYDTAFFSKPPPNQGVLIDNQPPTGQRLHLRPGIVVPIYFAGIYSRPQLWLDSTAYHINHFSRNNATRTLPIFAVDNSLYLYRYFSLWGHDYQQTLRPRLQYVYIPFENQDTLPNFDSSGAAYSYNRIFDLNNYLGIDRLQNANRVSLGMSSQLLDNNGHPILSADLAAIYYFTPPKVCLTPHCEMEKRNVSPIVTDLSYYFNQHWYTSVNYAYDPELQKTNNAAFNLTYQQDKHHTFNIGYDLTTDENRNVSNDYLTSGIAWAVNKRVTLFAYGYWDILRKRFKTYYGGVRFNNCCWGMSIFLQRNYIADVLSKRRYNNEYLVRIYFKGLGGLGGSNIRPLLKSTIPRYAA